MLLELPPVASMTDEDGPWVLLVDECVIESPVPINFEDGFVTPVPNIDDGDET